MSKKTIHYKVICKDKIYTRNELANTLGLTMTTLSCYVKKGLAPLNPRERPLLFEGKEAKKYFRELILGRKIKLQPGEIFCVKCRSARLLKRDTLRVEETNFKIGRGDNKKVDIIGLCAKCGTTIRLFSSLNKYKNFLQFYNWQYEKSHDDNSN